MARGEVIGLPEKKIAESGAQQYVRFDLVKGSLHRGIHADGAWGGVTPQGSFCFTFYSERFPIPQQVTHAVTPDNTIGGEVREARVARDAIVREAEVSVYMSPKIARSFRDMLSEQLEMLDKQMELENGAKKSRKRR